MSEPSQQEPTPRIAQAPKRRSWDKCTLPVAQTPGPASFDRIAAMALTGTLGSTELHSEEVSRE